MDQSILVLGREKNICLAELESLYKNLASVYNQELIEINLSASKINLLNLGGSIKLAQVMQKIKIKNLNQETEITNYLQTIIEKHLNQSPKNKVNLGLSFYGFKFSLKKVKKIQFEVKKHLKNLNYSVRFVPNENLSLSSAQVYHNRLTINHNLEIIIGLHETSREIILAQTTQIQDFNSYTNRDRNRPKRDSRVGMLPPKLAQIIINLATFSSTTDQNSSLTILDPFCGTGVLLQEALIMKYKVLGSDIAQKMIDYTSINLDWIVDQEKLDKANYKLFLADATTFQWSVKFNFVASETYLGLAFTNHVQLKVFESNMQTCNLIIKKFLNNLYNQIDQSTGICLAVPFWTYNNKNYHLDIIDHLSSIGYNLVKFSLVNGRLVYQRPNQFVGRELLVLKKVNKKDNYESR
jgi:tRNA G10  N-methylase Trm11